MDVRIACNLVMERNWSYEKRGKFHAQRMENFQIDKREREKTFEKTSKLFTPDLEKSF